MTIESPGVTEVSHLTQVLCVTMESCLTEMLNLTLLCDCVVTPELS